TCAVHTLMSALAQKRTSPALFCALNNALRATDQIDPNFACPPVVDNTGLVAKRLDFRGREVGHLHLIHLLKDIDGNHCILQSLPRFLLLLSHNYVSDLFQDLLILGTETPPSLGTDREHRRIAG